MQDSKNAATKLLDEFLDEEKSRTMKRYMEKLEEYDSETAEHCFRVGMMAYDAATKIGRIRETPLDTETLLIAGLGHDIGKLHVSKKTLGSKGTLNDSEWDEIKQHPEWSYSILKDVSDDAAEIALRHHLYQETPYPREIPSEIQDKKYRELTDTAVLLALIDKYDAFVTRNNSVSRSSGARDYLLSTKSGADIVEILYENQIFTIDSFLDETC